MPRSSRVSRPERTKKPLASNAEASAKTYRVGPGRPPKEHQFKKGQSGNPKGAPLKTSIAPDLKAALERALNQKVTLRQGDKEMTVTKAAAGIEQLVNQFAKGDRYARRDLIDLSGRFGVDLVAGQVKVIQAAIEAAIPAEDEALLADYVKRHVGSADPSGGDPIAVSEETSAEPDHSNPEEKTS
jgi:Family of unknown function (DUF5681)